VLVKDVTYVIKQKQTGEQKTVLENVRAIFNPGEICALMGPSGDKYQLFVCFSMNSCRLYRSREIFSTGSDNESSHRRRPSRYNR
jgi:hypothetical protein